MNLFDELRGILAALDDAKVDYALIGGLAVAVWGAPRATKDIDLLIRPDDVPTALAAARTVGFTLEALPFEFKDGSAVRRVNKVDGEGNVMTLDLLLVDGNLEGVWASRERLPFEGATASVVSRDALIGMKSRAARPQDLVDVQNLKEIAR